MYKEFNEIIGYDSIKIELEQVCDIIRHPSKYKKLGANIPRGLLIHGEPGVGKTLMANCLIKACKVPFYVIRKDIPDGDFVCFIKETFEKASQDTPSIVFLDDLDKFARTAEGDVRVNAEEFVTIQSCIDTYKDKEIFVLATTNSLEAIPDSLIRAGRFDRKIIVNFPVGEDAEKIINYYLSKKKCVESLNAHDVISLLGGGSCADLETLINEAAIYSAYLSKSAIDMGDLVKAALRTVFNAPQTFDVSKIDLRKVAYHEAGHVVVSELLMPGEIGFVTVIPHDTPIRGITALTPTSLTDLYNRTSDLLIKKIKIDFGGKASTELVFNTLDLGSSSDVQNVSNSLEELINSCFMDGFKLFSRYHIGDSQSNEFKVCYETYIYKHLKKYYKQAKKLLKKNRKFLDAVANALIEKQTLLGEDIQKIKREIYG